MRMIILAIRSKPRHVPALARTPFAKPIDPCIKLFNIMGCSTPPRDDPDAAIAIASVRRLAKWCATMLIEGTKASPAPRPTPSPWLRKTCYTNDVNFSVNKKEDYQLDNNGLASSKRA